MEPDLELAFNHSLQGRNAKGLLPYRRVNPVREHRARCLVSPPGLVEGNIDIAGMRFRILNR